MMKYLLALLWLFVLGAPLCAQNSQDTPAEFGYDVGFFNSQNHTSTVTISYKRLLATRPSVNFDQTATGVKGLPTKETLSFLNADGRVLGTLSSDFGAEGKLCNQTLTQGALPPRALN